MNLMTTKDGRNEDGARGKAMGDGMTLSGMEAYMEKFMNAVREIVAVKRLMRAVPYMADERETASRCGISHAGARRLAMECERLGMIRIRPGINYELYELSKDRKS